MIHKIRGKQFSSIVLRFRCLIGKTNFINNSNKNIIKMKQSPSGQHNQSWRIRLKQPIITCRSLPKKMFRIRSASKNKLDLHNYNPSQKSKQNETQNAQKERCSSVRSIRTKKFQMKSLATTPDEPDQQKYVILRNLKTEQDTLQRKISQNKQKQRQIARIFNPKTIMKLGRKKSQSSQQQNSKEDRKKYLKGQFRMNKYVNQSGVYKNVESKEQDEYWKRVNESLILAQSNATGQQISKDLKQIYDNLANN